MSALMFGLVLACLLAPALATGQSAEGVIRACVQKSSQQVRIIGGAESRRQTESLVLWNIQEVKGEKADRGETGSQGQTGPQGSPDQDGAQDLTGLVHAFEPAHAPSSAELAPVPLHRSPELTRLCFPEIAHSDLRSTARASADAQEASLPYLPSMVCA